MVAYYNEIDNRKAARLRQLISEEVIAPGDAVKGALMMSEQKTLKVMISAISSPVSVVGATRSASRCGRTIDLFGQEAVHVNRSARQGRREAAQIKDICGRHGKRSLKSAALQSFLESRLKARLPLDGWMQPF
jgi:hypothetical protein